MPGLRCCYEGWKSVCGGGIHGGSGVRMLGLIE